MPAAKTQSSFQVQQNVTLRRILLDGQWAESPSRMSVVSPWTLQPVTEVFEATAEQARAAGYAAAKAMPAMRAMTCNQRSDGLRKISSAINERLEEIAMAICVEVGKPLWLARIEVQRAARVFQIAAEEALRLPGEVLYPDNEPQGAGMVGRIQFFPRGPVLGITPFNFPLNLTAHKVAPALAAGCSIVIKPPPQGPTAALLLGEIVLQSGFPPAALQVLPGGLGAGQALCATPAFASVSFTGSARAGWSIKRNALAHQKMLLELGGNAAVIVDESADLDAAAKAVSASGYVYAGQVCISTQRVFVHKSVAQKFEQKLAEKILTEVPVSDKVSDDKTMVGPLIDKASVERVENWVNAAVQAGGRPLVQGRRIGERIVTPWLLENVPDDQPLSCEEVFGPVVVMRAVSDIHDAISQVNHSKYGLQTSLFTQSLKNSELCYREIESGAVLVNVPTAFRIDSALYGGIKESGFGREGVKEVVREFSEPKLLIVKP
jgi:acyl-CoA reductase-like NAD-dependent aldehyde dehydrogenase